MDRFSFLNAAHSQYFADLYDQYIQAPDTIEPSWRAFFQGFDFGLESSEGQPLSGVSEEQLNHLENEFKVIRLIGGYRKRGHLFTLTNPVRERRKYEPTLELQNFGLTEKDLDTVFKAGEIIGLGAVTLREIIKRLEAVYCQSIGIEYTHVRSVEEREWIQQWLQKNIPISYSAEQKKSFLRKLNEAVSFESFLHTKYVGQKRFSLEGGESFIPAVDAIINRAIEQGVEEFVMGMAHRGRLNTLVNIFGKNAQDIFSEFDGKDYEIESFDGDVKYHLGWTSHRNTEDGKKYTLNIAPNPSHLETVGALVQGITRAKQDRHFSDNIKKVLPIVVHGDAAIAGQGIVYEIIQMAQLEGYKTGGTIHMVINNQVGFTTNYLDGRSSIYCTDVSKVTQAPVLHVNSDDVEAVIQSVTFALDYRMQFGKDVFIDLLGYRKYGHNEGDEPRFTQPKLYKAIAKHKNSRDIYAEKLIAEGVVTPEYVKEIEEEYKNFLEDNLEKSRQLEKTKVTPFMEDVWEGFEYADAAKMLEKVDTTFDLNKLGEIATAISTLPSDKKFISKIARLINSRKTMFFEENKLDWAMGELLAYGTLLTEGYDVRISGQDVERGTFSHRHAVVKVEDSEEEVILHKNIASEQGNFYIYNSLLSEYAVSGFDYGYAMANPNALTIWEAQFGDFCNGAQIIIDQYISAAEDKWKIQNGLVFLLPHGYEGQGAEHSSARMERFLQLCSRNNMFVADVTTPANYFHLLRRHMKAQYRKPLIVFTPKSLLRHPKVVSTKEEMANGYFQEVIDDATAQVKKVKSLVFCTGKFYYDLLEEREKLDRDDVALVRLEQLFPLPGNQIRQIIEKYKNADDIVWAQEEPRNMGAYGFLLLHLEEAKSFRVCSGKFYSAPAPGSFARFKIRHQKVIDSVFDKSLTLDGFNL